MSRRPDFNARVTQILLWFSVYPGWHAARELYADFPSDDPREKQAIRNELKRLADDGRLIRHRQAISPKGPGTRYAVPGTPLPGSTAEAPTATVSS